MDSDLTKGSKKLKLIAGIFLFLVIFLVSFVTFKKYHKIQNTNNQEIITISVTDQSEIINLNKKVDSFGDVLNISEKQKPEYVEARFERLRYIAANRQIVGSYLIKNFDKKDSEEYKSLFVDYVLSDFPAGEEGVLLPKYLVGVKEQDTKEKTDWFTDTGYDFFAFQNIYFLDSGVILAIIVNKENSGAYNYDSYVYTYRIQNGEIEENVPEFVSYNRKISKIQKFSVNATNESDLGFSNISYSSDTKQLITEPFKPFGAYPCSEDSYYDIYFDRLILTKTEIPEYCIGRDFSDPYSADSIAVEEKEDTIFDKRKITYSITRTEYRKLLEYKLK